METIRDMVASAQDMGITEFLVDPGALPVGAGHGVEYRTLLAVKSQLGYPTSLAPHNAPSAWKFIKESDLDDERMHLATLVAASSAAQVHAADCIMFGSMIRAREAFGAAALIGNAISSAAAESGRAMGLERDLFEPLTKG
jgi:tetrahydromethanopterin S-methyltransferase subunit H